MLVPGAIIPGKCIGIPGIPGRIIGIPGIPMGMGIGIGMAPTPAIPAMLAMACHCCCMASGLMPAPGAAKPGYMPMHDAHHMDIIACCCIAAA